MYNGQPGQNQVVHVKIEDVNIPFLHLVGLILKFSIAAICSGAVPCPTTSITYQPAFVASALNTWKPA
jgi:hypothetical protein